MLGNVTMMLCFKTIAEKIVHAIQDPKAGGAPPEAAPAEVTAPSEDTTPAPAPTTEGQKTTAAATEAAGDDLCILQGILIFYN